MCALKYSLCTALVLCHLGTKLKPGMKDRAQVAEALRARRFAACFGRRLTMRPARIEPTAHWRHTASRRQRRRRRYRHAHPSAHGAFNHHRIRPSRNLPQPVDTLTGSSDRQASRRRMATAILQTIFEPDNP